MGATSGAHTVAEVVMTNPSSRMRVNRPAEVALAGLKLRWLRCFHGLDCCHRRMSGRCRCCTWEWRSTRTCWEVNALVAATGHIFGKVASLLLIVGGESTSLVIVDACEWDFDALTTE